MELWRTARGGMQGGGAIAVAVPGGAVRVALPERGVGLYPEAGGLFDQAAKLMDAFTLCDRIYAEARREDGEPAAREDGE